jgi:hypothetical protein
LGYVNFLRPLRGRPRLRYRHCTSLQPDARGFFRIFVIVGVQGDLIFTQQFPDAPLIYRVLRYLSLALLVVIALVVRPRNKT